MRHSEFRGCEFLVESLCRTIALEREAGRAIEALPPGEARDMAAKARRAEAQLVALLATKLRLSPRSRVDKRITLKTVPRGPRPWELPADSPDDAS